MAKAAHQRTMQDERVLIISAGSYKAADVIIEGDATAASYFIGLATLHNATVTLTNLGTDTHQGDYDFLQGRRTVGRDH